MILQVGQVKKADRLECPFLTFHRPVGFLDIPIHAWRNFAPHMRRACSSSTLRFMTLIPFSLAVTILSHFEGVINCAVISNSFQASISASFTVVFTHSGWSRHHPFKSISVYSSHFREVSNPVTVNLF